MILKNFLLLLAFIFLSCHRRDNAVDSHQQSQLSTVKDLTELYGSRIRALIEEVDTLQIPVQRALLAGDTLEACQRILHHFKNTSRPWVIATLDSMPEFRKIADRLMQDSIDLAGSLAKIPLDTSGGWQWNYTGVKKDDEFGYSLNGHRYLPALYFTHQQTPDNNLVRKFDEVIKDWIIQHPLPSPDDSIYMVLDTSIDLDWRDIGEVEWRTLEAGNRLGASWPALFFAFQSEPTFTDATRLLMLSSIIEQANYLRQYHKSKHNWTTMEMNGLALTGLAFPEFKSSADWSDYALNIMSDEIERQVYPDGVQTEISTKTQWVALNRFESVANHFREAGTEVTKEYTQGLEAMYHYLARCIRPDGHQPLNNDSDREDLRERILRAAHKFNRPDWTWIATNGKSGQIPTDNPSIVFPWAGISIMRNGWDENAQWSFFDIGPYGTGHQHRDKLHLSISAFGTDFLVDGGRYTHEDYFSFDPAIWRGYFRSSFSHNTILFDGQGQKAGELMAVQPKKENLDFVHEDRFDYATGIFDSGYENTEGVVTHRRSLFYLKSKFWLVFDQIYTDRPREIQALWHFHPDQNVTYDGQKILTKNEGGPNFQIIPSALIDWQIDLIQGQENPVKQGWYSADYGEKVPNATAVYSHQINGAISFAWLLIPSRNAIQEVFLKMEDLSDQARFQIKMDKNINYVIELPKDGNAGRVTLEND